MNKFIKPKHLENKENKPVSRRMNGKTVLAVFIVFLLFGSGIINATRYITDTYDSWVYKNKWNATTSHFNDSRSTWNNTKTLLSGFGHNWNNTKTQFNNSRSTWNMTRTQLNLFGVLWNASKTGLFGWGHNWNQTTQSFNNSKSYWTIWNQTSNSVTNWQATWNASGTSGTTYINNTGGSVNWYVSTSGSDTYSGNYTHPFKTLQKAINVSSSGDTIYIRAGNYSTVNRINIRHKNGASWLTITNFPNERVILYGALLTGSSNYTSGFIELYNCTSVRITGLKIEHSAFMAIVLQKKCFNIKVDNNTIMNNSGSAFKCASNSGANRIEYVEFAYNYLYKNMNNWSAWHDLSEECVSLSRVHHFNIHHNTILYSGAEVIDIKSGCRNGSVHHNIINNTGPRIWKLFYYWGGIGIYIDGFSSNCTNVQVYNNIVFGNNTGIQLSAEQAGGVLRNISVYNNIVNVTYTGTTIACLGLNENAWNTNLYDINVSYNTFRSVGYDAAQIRTTESTESYFHRIKIYNNILSGNAYYCTYFAVDYGTFDMANNLYYRYGSTTRNYWGDGENQFEATALRGVNPQFVSNVSKAKDYHLNLTSPAIDNASSSMTVKLDFDGSYRYKGRNYDIGAYEMEIGKDVFALPTTRPLSPKAGDMWFNSTTGRTATYDGTSWLWSGYLNQNWGRSSVTTAGRAVNVTHNLSGTPTSVLIVPRGVNCSSYEYYVYSVSATTFRVQVTAKLSAAFDFYWYAKV